MGVLSPSPSSRLIPSDDTCSAWRSPLLELRTLPPDVDAMMSFTSRQTPDGSHGRLKIPKMGICLATRLCSCETSAQNHTRGDGTQKFLSHLQTRFQNTAPLDETLSLPDSDASSRGSRCACEQPVIGPSRPSPSPNLRWQLGWAVDSTMECAPHFLWPSPTRTLDNAENVKGIHTHRSIGRISLVARSAALRQDGSL